MENNNEMVKAFNKAIADSGIQIEMYRDLPTQEWIAKVNTSVHDKQIKTDVIDELGKVICDDLDNGYVFTNKHQILHLVEQFKEQKNE